MYLDPAVLTAGALRLLQLLLNPFLTAGLQSAAYPNNGLPYNPMAAVPVAASSPPRQLSASAALLTALGLAAPGGPMQGGMTMATVPMQGGMTMATVPSMSSMPAVGPMFSMPSVPSMASMPSMGSVQPIPPWLLSQQLPAVPSTPTGPLFVPPTVVSGVLAQQGSAAPVAQPAAAQSVASEAWAALEQAIAPYTNGAGSTSTASTASTASTTSTASSANTAMSTVAGSSTDVSETASPMPMGSLIALLGNVLSGFRVVIVNFAASMAVMVGARLVRVVVQNLPIILNLLGLTRAGMARVIVDGVTRAQCLERAACLMGRHASSYPGTPDVLRWLRSPNPTAPEHPVWKAFRAAAEGTAAQCDAFTC